MIHIRPNQKIELNYFVLNFKK